LIKLANQRAVFLSRDSNQPIREDIVIFGLSVEQLRLFLAAIKKILIDENKIGVIN